MKSIPIIRLAEPSKEAPAGFSTKHILWQLVSSPSEPVPFNEAVKRHRVLRTLESLEAEATELLLEDEDFKTVKQAIESARVTLIDRRWMEAVEAVLAAADVDPNATKAAA